MGTHSFEGCRFELANPFACDTEFFADFEQGATASIAEAVALGDDYPFPWRKQGQRSMHLFMHFFTEDMLCGDLIESGSRTIFKCVGERGMGFIVHGQVKRNGLLDETEQLDHLVQIDLGSLGDLLGLWIPSVLLPELCHDTSYFA